MQSRYQTYKNCEGNRTPSRKELGHFLAFHNAAPSTPEICDQVLDEEGFSDKNYNTLISNVDTINHGYDLSAQDFDTNFLETMLLEDIKPVLTEEPITPAPSGKKRKAKLATTTDAAPLLSSGKKKKIQVQIGDAVKDVAVDTHVPTKRGVGSSRKCLSYKRHCDEAAAVAAEDENSKLIGKIVAAEPADVSKLVGKTVAPDENAKLIGKIVTELPRDARPSEKEEDEDETPRAILKHKPRGRYVKKMHVLTTEKSDHVMPSTSSGSGNDEATNRLFKNIIDHHSDSEAKFENNRLFASHVLDNVFYMFTVTKPVGGGNGDDGRDPFSIQFVNCVHSIYNEYISHHMHHDRYVLVATLERYRFLISYQLLLDLEIDIPQQEQFCEKKLADTNRNRCYFEEIKDFAFLATVINFFNLDKVFVQGKISLLLASIGENKARSIYNTLSEMMADKSLFTLPFHMCRKEASEKTVKHEVPVYVSEIMKLTRNLYFKRVPNNRIKAPRSNLIDAVVESLGVWLRPREMRSSDFKDKNNFAYKYGSVVRLLYDVADKRVEKLYKVKKENGTVHLIESYLNACRDQPQSHSFILITTKSDERITIIKMGHEIVWITTVIQDVVVPDIIKGYRNYRHHIFNMSSSNRKEINNRHNGMINLVANYTSGLLTMEEVKTVALNNFTCNYEVRYYPVPGVDTVNEQ
ncbi:ie1 [Peridroma alphabaculovirus]|uniref:Ie1 n=1 Tax=Peridroma alphabaculovirus TaxID=1346829 RepID=A0A068LMY3_9ABAC|nr:ie1 [Peridroma alphabaculovirus]AIE47856.1 ie1 [Peridroma alphabaculovirus]